MPTNDGNTFKGEFIGATKAQIEFIKDQLRDVRSELTSVASALRELQDFKAKVLAYAALGASVATFGVQLLMNKVGG